jgi:hypothetical protein
MLWLVDLKNSKGVMSCNVERGCDVQALPAAHRGFLMRARSIPVEQLYFHARSQGKRLVLCGAPHPVHYREYWIPQ